MWKKCTLLWREAHVEVKMAKHPMFGPFFGRSTAPHYTTTTRKGQPQQTTNSKQRTTNNNKQQPTTNNRQPTTDNRQPTTDNRQPTTNNHNNNSNNNNKNTNAGPEKHQKSFTLLGEAFWTKSGSLRSVSKSIPPPPLFLRVPKLGKKCRFDTFLGRFSAFRN